MDNEPADKSDLNQQELLSNRTQGHVVDCDGNNAIVSATSGRDGEASADYWSVGQLISIQCTPKRRVVGLLFKISNINASWDNDKSNDIHLHVELVGEVLDTEDGTFFTAGLSAYPHLGAIAHRIRTGDLEAIFTARGPDVARIGSLTQNSHIPALISTEKMISRHFAVVGTTGVGKSTAVSLLLHRIVALETGMRVLVLDPHNEFSRALPGDSITINEDNFSLPFWLFSTEEFGEAVFGGRSVPDHEMDLMRELISQAREQAAKTEDAATPRLKKMRKQITADTPMPYRITDLLKLIDARLGQLDHKRDIVPLRNLANRIQLTANDPDYSFMFGERMVTDNMQLILSHMFRIPHEGRPVTILQLGGIPSTVVNATVSVLCRMAFDLGVRSGGAIRTLIVCEEAHRYIPADTAAGFEPTRAIISRIAKEGRKYGVHLGIVTQRPSELDQTIMSQCNTIFAMRLGNERDQRIVQKALTGGSRSFSNFISSLANREAIAFGEGAAAPMRLTFDEVPSDWLPGMQTMSDTHDTDPGIDDLRRVIAAMRNEKSLPDDSQEAGECLPQRETVSPRARGERTLFSGPSSLHAAGPKPLARDGEHGGSSLVSRFRGKG